MPARACDIIDTHAYTSSTDGYEAGDQQTQLSARRVAHRHSMQGRRTHALLTIFELINTNISPGARAGTFHQSFTYQLITKTYFNARREYFFCVSISVSQIRSLHDWGAARQQRQQACSFFLSRRPLHQSEATVNCYIHGLAQQMARAFQTKSGSCKGVHIHSNM